MRGQKAQIDQFWSFLEPKTGFYGVSNVGNAPSQLDWLLMNRVAGGDEEAIAELYDRFGNLVYKVSRQFLSSHQEAEDALQDVFVRLWKTADRFDPRRAKLVTWVMLITRRHLIDQLRRKSVRPCLTGLEEEGARDIGSDGPERKTDVDERNAQLLSRVRELPELQRTVIERAYLQGFTLREVSEQLDSPLGTVKSALSRGLTRLREQSPRAGTGECVVS
jgi:RNA polymerase sigma-70 factor (ECF subfamily)